MHRLIPLIRSTFFVRSQSHSRILILAIYQCFRIRGEGILKFDHRHFFNTVFRDEVEARGKH